MLRRMLGYLIFQEFGKFVNVYLVSLIVKEKLCFIINSNFIVSLPYFHLFNKFVLWKG